MIDTDNHEFKLAADAHMLSVGSRSFNEEMKENICE